MKDLKSVVSKTVASYGFPVELVNQSPLRYQQISHDTIPNFHLKLRFWGDDYCQIAVWGNSILSERNVDYYDDDKSIRNLKNRLKRLTDVALEHFNASQKTSDRARAYKADIAEQIAVVNEHRQPNHNIVVDQDELVDDYKHLTVYYRSYELSPRLDQDGVVVFKETLFNKSKEFTLNDVVSLIDVMES